MSAFLEKFEKILNDASTMELEIANMGKINIINDLKKIKRTGKKIRLEKLNCKEIKVTTIYDHINSIARTADLLISKDLVNCDESKLASIIVYHDLCEVLITDYPRHTKNFKVNSNSIMNAFEVDKKIREEYATNFLWLFANKKQKECFDLLKQEDNEKNILWLIDKIDPIITIWRYMYVYKKQLKTLKNEYIEVMDDFFTNPVLNKIIEMSEYKYFAEIIRFLKDPNNAKQYLENDNLQKVNDLKEQDKEIIKTLVENTKLFWE